MDDAFKRTRNGKRGPSKTRAEFYSMRASIANFCDTRVRRPRQKKTAPSADWRVGLLAFGHFYSGAPLTQLQFRFDWNHNQLAFAVCVFCFAHNGHK